MQCPSCKTGTLATGRLPDGPEGHVCNACSGALIELASYNAWLNRAGHENLATPSEDKVSDSTTVLRCPACQRLMSRFKISADTAHSLDFCFHCGLIWLDAGEWAFLQQRDLHTKIRAVTSDAWQRQIREATNTRRREGELAQDLGAETFRTVDDFRRWLDAQPHRAEILRYLQREPGSSS